MASTKQSERRRILAPTTEEVEASRKRVQTIIKETSAFRHPFTRADFEAFGRAALRPLVGKKKDSKKSADTSESCHASDSIESCSCADPT